MEQIAKIKTEQRNADTIDIDRVSTMEMVRRINAEDKKVATAVEQVLPQIAEAIDLICRQMERGGRLVYCGCGTSGRLGALDAAECPPTFGTDPEMVTAILAGGPAAMTTAAEGAEDTPEEGEKSLRDITFRKEDILVGIAASGRTPFVLGAMEYARRLGASVIGVTCCPGSEVDRAADIGISPQPGPEVITGSTRLKCGTAQKMVLNMLSTGVMIHQGKVYSNLMVDVKATNQKLRARAVTIVCAATGVSREEAAETLELADYASKTAIIMILCDVDKETANEMLALRKGRIADVILSQEDGMKKDAYVRQIREV
mgnify:CR=1 FL=1